MFRDKLFLSGDPAHLEEMEDISQQSLLDIVKCNDLGSLRLKLKRGLEIDLDSVCDPVSFYLCSAFCFVELFTLFSY